MRLPAPYIVVAVLDHRTIPHCIRVLVGNQSCPVSQRNSSEAACASLRHASSWHASSYVVMYSRLAGISWWHSALHDVPGYLVRGNRFKSVCAHAKHASSSMPAPIGFKEASMAWLTISVSKLLRRMRRAALYTGSTMPSMHATPATLTGVLATLSALACTVYTCHQHAPTCSAVCIERPSKLAPQCPDVHTPASLTGAQAMLSTLACTLPRSYQLAKPALQYALSSCVH